MSGTDTTETGESTTPDTQSTTSFDEMARSVPWNKTVALGQKIIREWEDRPSVLVRWMSHRIAELMRKAEEADSDEERDAARSECTDLIIRLWERRNHWPYGSPLDRVTETLSAITSEPEIGDLPEPDRPDPSMRWEKMFQDLRKLQNEETSVLLYAMAANVELSVEEDWIGDHRTILVDQEREVLSSLIELRRQASSEHFTLGPIEAPNFATRPEEERSKLILESLENIADQRKEVIHGKADDGE